jgi:spore cortex biosynthesis protein YabQ
MNEVITIELRFFLISVLWGVILLFVYDILRILRRLLKHNGFFVALEDLIFWVVASVFIFAMMYNQNNGIIRGFSVIGTAAGMVLYHNSLSEWLVLTVTKIIYTLLRPIIYIFKKVKKIILFITNKGKKLYNFLLLQLKELSKSVKIAISRKKQKASAKRNISKDKRADKKKRKSEQKHTKKKNIKTAKNGLQGVKSTDYNNKSIY